MPLVQGVTLIAAESVPTFTMDATTDFVAFRFLPRTTAPITGVEVFVSTKTGTPGNLECVLTGNVTGKPIVSGGVPTDIGGGSPTLVSIANAGISNNSRLTITFTNPFTPTAGTWYWVVLYPGAGGSGWSASHRYIFRFAVTIAAVGVMQGDELSASSTDTGANFTTQRGIPYVSWLTTGAAYLPTIASCCFDSVGTVDVDDTSNPDERGSACTVPANTTASIIGLSSLYRIEAVTSDFTIAAYSDNTSLESRAIDTSEFDPVISTNMASFFFLADQSVAAGAIARVAIKATNASDFFRFQAWEFGSQARRESAKIFADSWYCNRNGGAGSFTDDKTRWYSVVPHVSFVGTGGGGSGANSRGELLGGILQ